MFLVEFSKLFESIASKLQIDQLNKDLQDKHPSTNTRIINIECFLKFHKSPAGVTGNKIAWRSLHGPFDDGKN